MEDGPVVVMHTATERPDLWARGIASSDVWPEYNLHGNVANRWWPALEQELADYQFVLFDEETDNVVAEGHTGPFWWDGDAASLPDGFDATIERVIDDHRVGGPVNTLTALAAEVPRQGTRHGLAAEILRAMRTLGERHGLVHFVAPLRPVLKSRYPLVAIEEYVTWRRADGSAFDPWIRVHERLGARVATPLPRSFRITGTVAEWESWTGLEFPVSGDYVFPEGLALVHIDRARDLGSYWEPNVWLIHPDIGRRDEHDPAEDDRHGRLTT
jgi:hypothetical protein